MKIPIRNKTGSSLGIMLEPWTDTVELASDQEAEVEFDGSGDEIIIDVCSENFMSLWVPPGATIKIRSEAK